MRFYEHRDIQLRLKDNKSSTLTGIQFLFGASLGLEDRSKGSEPEPYPTKTESRD